MLEAVGFPVAVNPETRLAAIARKRGWLVEHWSKAAGGPRPLLPIGPLLQRARARTEVRMRLIFERKPVKFAAARLAGTLAPGRGAAVGPLKLEPNEPLPLPGPDWVRLTPRLSGICGSDLAMIDGTASAYFDPLVSYPFVPGHEVVATTERGRRVALGPGAVLRRPRHQLRCAANARRGAPTCASASRSATSNPGCRAASAPTPVAAGARGWSPTPASWSTFPTISATRPR